MSPWDCCSRRGGASCFLPARWTPGRSISAGFPIHARPGGKSINCYPPGEVESARDHNPAATDGGLSKVADNASFGHLRCEREYRHRADVRNGSTPPRRANKVMSGYFITVVVYAIFTLLAVLLGFASHRGSICMVKAVSEILSTRGSTCSLASARRCSGSCLRQVWRRQYRRSVWLLQLLIPVARTPDS